MKYFAKTRLSENMAETPEGYLLCLSAPIARTGEQVYGKGETPLEVGEDGLVTIVRDQEDVFDPATIASFEGKSFTIKHPKEFVDSKNWQDLTYGIIQNVRRGSGENENDLLADILITSADAISLVKNGMRELSCGYECSYIELGAGRGKQVKIVGNHVALVDEGRAGPKYSIKDHKGAFSMGAKDLKDKVMAIFGKALDEAMPEEKKPDEKMKDDETVPTMQGIDELVKMCKDLGSKLDAMKPKEEAGDEEVASGLEDRLKALEAAVAKMMESSAGDEEPEVITDEDETEMGDDDMITDEEMEKKDKAGDTAARAEILAPGIKMTKDVKAKALKACYGTKEGKKVIDTLTGGKAPTFDSAPAMETMFLAASELMKKERSTQLERKYNANDFKSSVYTNASDMTPEKLNEINAKYWETKAK